ncbi:pitrilysin family protein [Puniceibacterium sp. IMCC21224]|uniref:M16 family metallopeptidase n=1 Tax=Puniceibacterium sp. IMCC21224 TaxID=1618204 RepID=UPI00064D787D|nr:pitrilysin family protein [Puniceibacterium sp. IMCC21224]KMK68788.1 putative Zn-dependent peptidase [Puniceibacterium sp. IMCC21224]
MLRLAGLTVAFAVAVATAQAQTVEDAVSTFTLDNGLDVVVIEDHRAPAVVHMLWYRAGSADETAGTSGVAHFLEHLLFKGTDTLAPGEFSKVVAANGGSDNAFTSFDYTGYFQRVASDRLGLMMQMESDRMVNLRLDDKDIATEREVIIEERNTRVENDPGALFSEQRSAAQYLNHRYGVPIIGWRHEMEELDLDKALAFYHRNYAPNNAILIVAGDATPQQVRALAEEHYGPIPANPELSERMRPQEPPQTAERRLLFRDARVAQPYVMRTYLAPARDPGQQEKAAALVMLSEILGGGQTSVFKRKLEFETQTAVYTGAFYDATALDDTTFGLVIVPSEGTSLQEAEDAMDAAVAEFMAEGVDADQLNRIKFQMKAQQIYARDSADRIARRYGGALTAGLSIADIQAWPDVLQAVTAEDILEVAKEVFQRETSVTGWLMGAQEMTQ